MSETFLFIGGSHNGDRIPFSASPGPRVELPVKQMRPAGMGSSLPRSETIEIEIYVKMELRGGDESFFVFHWKPLTAAEVMRELIAQYRPEATNAGKLKYSGRVTHWSEEWSRLGDSRPRSTAVTIQAPNLQLSAQLSKEEIESLDKNSINLQDVNVALTFNSKL